MKLPFDGLRFIECNGQFLNLDLVTGAEVAEEAGKPILKVWFAGDEYPATYRNETGEKMLLMLQANSLRIGRMKLETLKNYLNK